jgi:uncharacterized protein YgbK (DUF1537 family)
LLKIGEWFSAQQKKHGQLFSVGGSGIELALGNYWNKARVLKPVTKWKKIPKAKPLLVISGSCSPVTAGQIAYAKANGFEELIIDAVKICKDGVVNESVMKKIDESLNQKKNLIVHTGEMQTQNLYSEKLGTALGVIAKDAVINTGIKRVVISGGDSSSYAARAMEIDAVEMIAPLVIGAPLCKVYSKNKDINGLEINFKGGQVGGEKYFEILLNGDAV